MSNIVYRYSEGDKVWFKGQKYIVEGRYYPNGPRESTRPAYTLYPPGHKNSYGKYFWVYETDDLTERSQ